MVDYECDYDEKIKPRDLYIRLNKSTRELELVFKNESCGYSIRQICHISEINQYWSNGKKRYTLDRLEYALKCNEVLEIAYMMLDLAKSYDNQLYEQYKYCNDNIETTPEQDMINALRALDDKCDYTISNSTIPSYRKDLNFTKREINKLINIQS